MKALVYSFVSLMILASAAVAGTYRSVEKPEDAIAKNRLQYAVHVTTLGKITDPKIVGEHDFAEKVRVEVFAKDPKKPGQFKAARNPFETVAFLDDVMFSVSAWRKHGVSLMIYLDELDQTSVKLKGVRGSLQMETDSNE
jgi:hypothetical protein